MESLLSKFVIKMPDKLRQQIVGVLLFYIVLCSWIDKTIIQFDSILFYMSSCAVPFLLVLILNDGNYRKFKVNKIFLLFFVGYIATFLAGSVLTGRMGSILLGVTYMVAFPLLAIVSSTDEKRRGLVNGLFNGLIYNFYLILVISFFIADPQEQTQYSGILMNPNGLGLIALTTFIGSGYNVYKSNKWIDYIGTGISVSVLFFTQSRSALICVVTAIIIMVIAIIRTKKFDIIANKKVIATILSGLAMFGLIFYVTPISESAHDYVSDYLMREEAKANIRDVEMDDRNFDRLTDSMGSDRDFSTGRFAIWEAYIEGISLTPNGDDVVPKIDGKELTMSAHNTYIHLAYCFGLLCGVFYLLFNVTTGLLSIKLMKRKNSLALFNFIIVLTYGITTLVETSYNFVTYIICFAYWLFTFGVAVPLMGSEEKDG